MRKEVDVLGSLDINDHTLWGIHTERARRNFAISRRYVPYSLIAAIATVKRAAALTNAELGYLPKNIADAIASACIQVASNEEGCAKLFPLDALQGGAGTSTNMNVNEVVANLALEKLGKTPGAYETVDPIAHVNLHQSTNDVYPTALRIAAIAGVRTLADSFARLQGAFQAKENEFSDVVKMGRTEMQPAVPMTLGQEFSAFAEAVARDRWRTFKCEERLRMVNIGGTAVGTGLTAPRAYIFRVIEVLRNLTGMGLARSENVIDGTANADIFVEVSGILKAAAATIAKISSDLRLLHSIGEIALPPVQAGSSIMPGKVNPVIMECMVQIGMVVRANDMTIAECAAHGTLQINEFMPLIAASLLESIDILTSAANVLTPHIEQITANRNLSLTRVENSPALMTALLPHIGYDRALELMNEYKAVREQRTLKEFLVKKCGQALTESVLSSSNLVGLGYVDKGTP